MPSVEKSIEIYAPVEVVFDYIANRPEQMPDWWRPIELQQRLTPPPTTLGSRSRYVYNMMGVKIKGEHEVKALTENHHLYVKTLSGIDSAFSFTVTPSSRGTTLTVRVDYNLPGSVLGQLLNKLAVEQKNDQDLGEGLNNLKSILEAHAPA